MTRTEPVPEPAPTRTAPADHRTTSVVVGAVAAAWDRLSPPTPDRIGLRALAVGAVFELEDALGGLLTRRRTGRAARARQGRVVRLAVLVERARLRVERLAQRGAVEEDSGRRRAAEAVDSLVAAVANAAVVDRFVDAQVDRLLRPLVGSILDEVVAQLQNEPERVRSLVRDQRDSMVTELVDRLRQNTAAGDTTVDRITARLIRRAAKGFASEPAPTPGPGAT